MFAGCSTAYSSAQHKALEKMNRQDYDKTVYTVLSALPVSACSARAEYLLNGDRSLPWLSCPQYVGIA